jgi:hypothetical protein
MPGVRRLSATWRWVDIRTGINEAVITMGEATCEPTCDATCAATGEAGRGRSSDINGVINA